MLFHSLLCAYAFAPTTLPQAERTVTFTGHAAPLYRLLPELSKVADVKLEASPQMADTVMIVKVDKVPLKDLMKRMADASTGEWEKAEEGYRLALSSSKAAAERQSELKQMANAIDDAIDAQTAKWRKVDSDGSTIGYQTVALMLRSFGLLRAASLQTGLTFTFSSNPVGAELPIPPALTALADTCMTRNKLNNPNAVPPYTVHFLVRIPKFSNCIQASFSVDDVNGHSATGASETYVPAPARPRSLDFEVPVSSLVLSDDAKQYAKILAGRAGHLGTGLLCAHPNYYCSDLELQYQPLPDEVLRRVLRPDLDEPLAACAGVCIEWLAGARNIIATVPDSVFAPSCRFLSSWDGKSEKLVDSMANKWGLEYRADASWLTVTPSEPSLARAYRVHRREFALALGKASKQGLMPLNEQVNFARTQPASPVDGNFQFAYLRMVNPYLGLLWAGHNGGPMGDALRFYGSLTPGQYKQAASNDGLRLKNLSSSQLSEVVMLVQTKAFDLNAQEIDESGNISARRSFLRYTAFDPANRVSSVWGDTLRIKVLSYAEGLSVFGVGPRGIIDPIGIPQGYAMTGGAISPMVAGLPRSYSKYRLGKRNHVQLTIGVEEDALGFHFYDDSVDSNSSLVSHDDLPKEYLDALDKVEKQVQEALKGFGGSTVGRP